MRARASTRTSAACHARRAGADVADAASARSGGRWRCPSFPRGWCRRCSRSRTGGSTRIPASIRSDGRRAVHTTRSATRVSGRRQHDHPAARAERLPDRRDGHRAADAAAVAAGARCSSSSCRSCSSDAASKDEILELYLNDVYLGQRGSFAIHGVPKRRGCIFGKDVSNLSLGEAATIAGVIQSPGTLSPFNNPARVQERRNVVLQAMADAGYVTAGRRRARVAGAAGGRAARARSRGAVLRRLRRRRRWPTVSRPDTDAPRPSTSTRRSISTCSGWRRTRCATAWRKVDQLLARRKRRGRAAGGADRGRSADRRNSRDGRRPVVQPVAVQPRDRSRTAAGIGVQAVRLPGGVRAAPPRKGGPTSRRPSLVNDEPRRSSSTSRSWTPENYEKSTTARSRFRHALAMSRNLATIQVAEAAGYDRVAALWKKLGVGTPPKAYPSIALGVFEATPLEIATGVHACSPTAA